MNKTHKTLRPQNLKLALRANSGLALGTIYPLDSNRNILGRSVDAAVAVDDAKVSRNHATVDIQNGFHYLADLGSINGTYLNGERIDHAIMISVGDRIRIGSAVFHVELLDQAKIYANRSWREATRAIVMSDLKNIQQLEDLITPSEASMNCTGARWRSLLEPKWVDRFHFNEINRKWISLGICLLLVCAAIATSFGKWSN